MIRLKELENIHELTLNKMDGTVLAVIDIGDLNTISKSITDVDKIDLTIPKYVMSNDFKKVLNPLYMLVRHERLITVNGKEVYIIRSINNVSGNYKNITAESREVILKKIDLKFEDIGLMLNSSEEENGIYSLNDYMYEETGWRFGHIDTKVEFQEDGTTSKMRWQESIEGYWYEYLTNTVAEQFECIVIFDTYNKLVNLYDIDSFGGGIKICLSNDNYVRSLEQQTSSSDIVTRLRLVGNEGITINDTNPSNVDYLENYSYFIENQEMSNELINALDKFNEVVNIRAVEWNRLIDFKNEKSKVLLDKKMDMLELISNIKYYESLKVAYEASNDIDNMALAMSELTKLRDKEVLFDIDITSLEDEIELLDNSINEIIVLCQKPTATDMDGNPIFNEVLLNELKDFTYTDTFSDDSYLDINDLVSVGRRILEIKCKPTSTWDIDVVDFTSRIIDNNFRQHFNGILQLGDIIILEDSDGNEEFVFLVGYSKDFKSSDMSLVLSNKKVDRNDLLRISDLFTDAKKTAKLLNSKRYLFVKQEKNRINLDYSKGGM